MLTSTNMAIRFATQSNGARVSAGLFPPQFQPFIMLVLFGALMYFLLIRPQKKKQQEAQKVKESMKVGDNIVTIGGIRGRVTSITEDSFEIETGSDHMRLEFLKQALSYIVTPVAGMENTPDDGLVSSDELAGESHEEDPYTPDDIVIEEEEELGYDEDDEL